MDTTAFLNLIKKTHSRLFIAISFGIFAFSLTILFDLFPISERIELLTLDIRYNLRPKIQQSEDIVMINIDDKSLELFGHWPWSRRYQVALLKTLAPLKTRYIIYDVFFSEHEAPSVTTNPLRIVDYDEELQKAIKEAGNVYLAYPSRDPSKDMPRDMIYETSKAIFDKSDKEKKGGIKYILSSLKKTDEHLKNHLYKSIDLDPPIFDLLSSSKGHGFAQPGYSKDGVVRNFILFKDYSGYMLNALTLPVIVDLFDIKIDKSQIVPSEKIIFSRYNKPNIELSIDKNLQSLLNWVDTADNSFTHISFKDIIHLHLFNKAKDYLKDTKGLSQQKRLEIVKKRLIQEALLPDKDINEILKHISKDDGYVTPMLKARIKGTYKEISPTELKDKIILIGLTGKNTIDLNPTPFEPSCPMVFYHANVINMFKTEQFLTYPQPHLKYYISFAFAIIICLIGLKTTVPKTTTLSIVLLIVFLVVAYFLWVIKGQWVEVVIPIFALLSAYVICLVFQVLTVYRERSKIRQIFSAMVSPKVLTLMEKNPSAFALTGERRFATIYFSKIEGIEPIIQTLNPQELPTVLSYYLTPMSQIIMDYDGYIDKYEGAVIMADFGVPLEDKDNHIKCALSSLEQVIFINAFRHHIKEFYMMDANVSIGINSGYVSAGNMGSESKFQYTVMGDPVNTSARLMAANSIYQSRYPIVSEETAKLIEDFVYARPLDKLLLKGKTVPTKLYDVIGWKRDGYLEFVKGKKTIESPFTLWAKIPAGCIVGYYDFWNKEYERNHVAFAKEIRDFFKGNITNAHIILCLDYIKEVLNGCLETSNVCRLTNTITHLPLTQITSTIAQNIETISNYIDKSHTEDAEQSLKLEALNRRLKVMLKRAEVMDEKIRSNLIDKDISMTSLKDVDDMIEEYKKRYDASLRTFIKGINIDKYLEAIAFAGEPTHKEIVDIFGKGLELYWQRRWDDAIDTFNKASLLDKTDKPSMLMISRIQEYKTKPPDTSWQGEFIQTKK
ncbi:MAG: adenylate/guanylate cyclase domain-containing protein [Thermodesulfovibrionales bacterium]|nr:adenylate/guanylate cyclase domain-containing protein [Thermodesulfovibrionales bacterium]